MMLRLARVTLAFVALASAVFATAGSTGEVSDLLRAHSTSTTTEPLAALEQAEVSGDAAKALAAGPYAQGRRLFETPWVEAPASVTHLDGLGPFFSSRSCSGCHAGAGRGRPPRGPEDRAQPMFTRLLVAEGRENSGDPRYGHRLSERAVRGVAPEGRVVVHWEESTHIYPDGAVAALRRPRLELEDMAYGPLSSRTALTFRIAPAVRGVGLLEAVPDSRLTALADPDDVDRDGISGRVHWRVASPGEASPRTGRFGWKAAQASLSSQVSVALLEELGITTGARPAPELTSAQASARAHTSGGSPELDDARLAALIEYCRLAAVPKRRDLRDPGVRRGAGHFRDAGCVSCHVPSLPTGAGRNGDLARGVIHPFTDLLLHDMGAELADALPEADAGAAEWRTPPLWGLGAAAAAGAPSHLMHDGRARTFEEAILWHGGEAAPSRERFRALPAAARRDLLRFLGSL